MMIDVFEIHFFFFSRALQSTVLNDAEVLYQLSIRCGGNASPDEYGKMVPEFYRNDILMECR